MIFILFIPLPLSKFSQSESAIPDSINIGYLSIYHSHSVYMYVDFRAFFQCITKVNIDVQDFIDIYIYQRFAHEHFCVMSYFEY